MPSIFFIFLKSFIFPILLIIVLVFSFAFSEPGASPNDGGGTVGQAINQHVRLVVAVGREVGGLVFVRVC